MARLRVYLLSTLLCTLLALGQGDEVATKGQVVTITVPTVKPTDPITTDDPTTEPPTTEPPTTTSPPPTTTVPTTTTSTTTPKSNTTTTSTTTVAPPTPAPAPGPLPPPEQGTWWFTEGNVTCIVVQFAAQLNVTYNTNFNNTPLLAHTLLNIPKNASVVGGSCNVTNQWLQLSWPNDTWANNVTLRFARNDTLHQYALAAINVTLTPDQNFPNATSTSPIQLWHSAGEWATPLATSYRCTPASQLNLTELDGAVATMTLSRLQEEAFRTKKDTGFSAARECGSSDVPDAVPIAVGCALGGLVLVVLVAYLVGRRRSAARGYLSM